MALKIKTSLSEQSHRALWVLRAPSGAWQSAVNHFSIPFLGDKRFKADRHVALKGSSRWQPGNTNT